MARQAKSLTERQVRSLGAGKHADGNGLYLVVEESGARRWIARVQIKGMVTPSGIPKRMELGLGNTAVLSLDEARTKALEMKRQGRQGINPIEADESRLPSFQALFDEWFPTYKVNLSNEKHIKQWESTMREYVMPTIGGLRVDMVGQSHVLQCVEPIWSRKPETARRVMQRIAKVLDVARAKQFRTGENPVEIIKRANVLSRNAQTQVEGHAALPWSDLPAFWSELLQKNGTASIALQFTILTAVRTSETLGALWSEIDLGAKTWTIPASRMKARNRHVVPLSDGAVQLLTSLHEFKRGDLIFEGQKAIRPLSNMAMAQLLKRMNRTAITVHGFRSTFKDWCGDNGVDRELSELSLAHRIGNAVEQAYARSELLERRRELMEAWWIYIKKD